MQQSGIRNVYPVLFHAKVIAYWRTHYRNHWYYCLFSRFCKYPVLLFFVSQAIGISGGYLLYLLFDVPTDNQRLLLFGIAGFSGGIAALVGSLAFGLPWWWIVINLAFPPAISAALMLNIEPWAYFAGFAVLLAVNWNTSTTRVPLYLTNHKTWNALAKLLPEDLAIRFVDLGSGLGGTLRALAKSRPDSQFTGLETAPFPIVFSKLRRLFWGLPNVHIHYSSIWDADLASYDVVYCFLSPAPMTKMFEKARSEMQAGSIFISNSFHVEGHEPDKIIVVEDARNTNLLVWQM